jgi:hypothetical protein
MKQQRPGLLTTGVVLLHDDTRPMSQLLQHFKWTILEHLPYSPDLVLSDFHLFPALKDHPSGYKFASDDGVKTAVKRWLKSQGTEFYKAGLLLLLLLRARLH